MTMRRVGLWFATSLVAFTVLSGMLATDAHHAVLRFNLEEMTLTADRIFLGRCLAVEEAEEFIAQGDMPVTRYTFEVERAIRGRLPERITFRQLGHLPRRALGKGGEMTSHGQVVTPGAFIHGMTEYHVGDRAVLFLVREYLGGKVTYPVGLYQGAFFISRMPSGQELARNTLNNLGLFTAPYNGTSMKDGDARVIFPERDEPISDAAAPGVNTQALLEKRGALPLDSLLRVVDQIMSAHGVERGALVNGRKGASVQ